MTELEQLRKEINELRERVAVLERRPIAPHVVGPITTHPVNPLAPPWVITSGVTP